MQQEPLTPEPGLAALGVLRARPTPPWGAGPAGRRAIGLGADRDGTIVVPSGYRASAPAPLLLLLHGAGGRGSDGGRLLQLIADAIGAILVMPDSRGATWDVILRAYGPDVAFIDQVLNAIFGHYAVDPRRVAVGGFSDGASYALSLGLANGNLFTHIVACAPGYIASTHRDGRPKIFVVHGQRDRVLPIDRCSRRIVPYLQRSGYDVTYHEFDGGHIIPPLLALRAARWLAATPAG